MLALLAVLQFAPLTSPECIDPAVHLRRLASIHVSAEMLEAAGTRRMAEAFRAYLESGSRPDYRTAQVRYEAKGTGGYDHHARGLVLGLLYASGPDLNPAGSAGYRHRLVEQDARASGIAVRHLVEAAALDSAAWLPGVALAHVALGSRKPEVMNAALAALRRTLRQGTADVVVRTALADLLVAQDQAAGAAALLDGRTEGCPAADAAFAEALLLIGDTLRGAPLLLSALDRAPADQLDRYIEDVAVLLGPAERASLSAVPPAARARWIREFWERSAAASARSLAARLQEHVRRTARAHREYRLQTIRTTALAVRPVRGSPDISLVQTGDPAAGPELTERLAAADALPWDARGQVYVRHGQPDTVIASQLGQQIYLPENETWVYARAVPPWLVHFARSQGPDWFFVGPWIGCGDLARPALSEPEPGVSRRMNPRVNAPGAAAERARIAARAGAPGATEAREYYLARARLDERYDELASHCAALVTTRRDPRAIAGTVKGLARDYEEVVSSLLTSESARRPLERPLRLLAGAYAFRDPAGNPELASFAWVPAADIAQLDQDAVLDLSFSIVAAEGPPVRVDTVAGVRGDLASDGSVLRMTVSWPAVQLPAEARMHVFVGDAADPARGGYAELALVPVGRAALAMSSIVVAVPGEDGPLARGRHRVAPEPGHIVALGDGFRLFYELYGVAAEAPLQTTVRIRRTREDDLEGLLARFSGKRAERELRFVDAAEPDERGIVVRDVAVAGELLPGEYAVEIRVRTPRGELRGSTALRIREP